jgi:hypothetical protein
VGFHDMIERVYFFSVIFSQKRNVKRETHMADVILPGTQEAFLFNGCTDIKNDRGDFLSIK